MYIEVKITSLHYKDEKLELANPIVVVLTRLDTTPIIRLGVVGGKEVGMRLELLKSNIGLERIYVLGKAFFSMTSNGWKLSNAIFYNGITPKIVSSIADMKDEDFVESGNSFESITETSTFTINYRERRYIIR